MNIEKFIDKTDLLLYKGILNKIFKEFDTIDHQKLGDLLDKLRELHNRLDGIVKQKKTQSMFDKRYYTSQFDRKNIENDNNTDSISLKNIYRKIRDKRKISS